MTGQQKSVRRRISEAKAPTAYLHGNDGPVVIVSAHVAAFLKRRANLDALRTNARDMGDLETYWVLNSLQQAALSYDPLPPLSAPSAVGERDNSLSSREAAATLGITARGVRDALEKGRLDGHLIDGRWRITRAAVDRYIEQGR
jgi:excisionase family DNA binding protein